MNEPCRNIGCNQERNGRCTGVACGGADSSSPAPDGSVLPFGLTALKQVLVRVGLVHEDAYEVPNEFDGGVTAEATLRAYEKLERVAQNNVLSAQLAGEGE